MPNPEKPFPRSSQPTITKDMARQLYTNMQSYVTEAINGILAVPVYHDRYAPFIAKHREELTRAFLAPFEEILIGPPDEPRYHPPRTLAKLMDEISDNYEPTSQRVQKIKDMEKPEFNLFYEVYLGLCEQLREDAAAYLTPPSRPDHPLH